MHPNKKGTFRFILNDFQYMTDYKSKNTIHNFVANRIRHFAIIFYIQMCVLYIYEVQNEHVLDLEDIVDKLLYIIYYVFPTI